ncbi:hypothetical protein K2173_012797 [Erythroxylum novogranatense]|uniref:Uncharacterized protein n=1 Tax=Erythroxylum novogranatense TaxID=1862640 RepID=A0AAV8S6U4_9ROSI|nr:hypothetical protein K2173_012797 [Erythroxylum novogranatense]
MGPWIYFLSLSLSFLLFLAQSEPSIYDHLQRNGLPIGLLPKGVTDYSLDPSTGEFRINLTQPCNAKFENLLHYDFNVSGHLSLGKIGNLSGMSQQELFIWLPVKGIRVDVPSSGVIYFDVGVADKQFSSSLFENPIECNAADLDVELLNLQGLEIFRKRSDKLAFEDHQGGVLRAVS